MSLENFGGYKKTYKNNLENISNDNQKENSKEADVKEKLRRENEESKKGIYDIIAEVEAYLFSDENPKKSILDKDLKERIEWLRKKVESYPGECTRNSHIIHMLRNMVPLYGIQIIGRRDYRKRRNKEGIMIEKEEKKLRERKSNIKKERDKIMSYLKFLTNNKYFEKEIGEKDGYLHKEKEVQHTSSKYINHSIKKINKK